MNENLYPHSFTVDKHNKKKTNGGKHVMIIHIEYSRYGFSFFAWQQSNVFFIFCKFLQEVFLLMTIETMAILTFSLTFERPSVSWSDGRTDGRLFVVGPSIGRFGLYIIIYLEMEKVFSSNDFFLLLL